MANNKKLSIPSASHGKHRFPYNFPVLTTGNFNEVFPIYYKPLDKGEKDHPQFGVFSRLLTMNLPAFVTGRLRFDAYFVPYKHFWMPHFAFKTRSKYYPQSSAGVALPFIPNKAPYTTAGNLLSALVDSPYLTFAVESDADDYDILVNTNIVASPVPKYYKFTAPGKVVFRILCNLGCVPNSWWIKDTRELQILPLLAYVKAFLDYKFPNQYYGNSVSNMYEDLCNKQYSQFSLADTQQLIYCLYWSAYRFYTNSTLDNGFDNPVGVNSGLSVPTMQIDDITNPDDANSVDNDFVSIGTPVTTFDDNFSISKYLLDGLKSMTLLVKRLQLAGGRLLDRLAVQFGIKYSNDDVRKSYRIGFKYVEINVDAVENNSNTNLGELAGKGVAAVQTPIDFGEYVAPDDGIMIVLCSVIPDADLPIVVDPFVLAVNRDEFYTPEYDKLGVEMVPGRVIRQGGTYGNPDDVVNQDVEFLPRYYYKCMERPRLSGDFILKSAGAETLNAYHTFRLIDPKIIVQHSLSFINGASDAENFQRVFAQSVNDNFMVFVRVFGQSYLEKLPLGDSYDWDDDEMNKRINVELANE